MFAYIPGCISDFLKTFFIPPFSVFYFIILVHFFIIYPIDDLREDVKEQISYDYACTQFGEERVDSIVNLIMEVCLSAGSIFIGKHELPARQVKNVFQKINIEHLRYVFDSLEESSREKKIRNMKSYLLTALYNAPITIDTYYASEVNYDMCNGGEN